MKIVLILFLFSYSSLIAQNTEVFKDSIQNIIYNELKTINSNFSPTKKNYSIIKPNEKKEIITIYKIDKNTTIYRFNNYENTPSSLFFYEINKKLRYAKEIEMDSYISCISNTIWQCEYYFSDDKLIYYESLGHGKSEDENWNPDLEIKKQYKYCLQLINKN